MSSTEHGSVTGERVAAISRWIDGSPSYAGIDPEAAMWRRTMKVVSEAGEAYDALGGMLGENPRKGVTATLDDLIGELLDVALAALGGVEHLTGNEGRSIELLDLKVAYVMQRAGLAPSAVPSGEVPRG